MTLAPDSLTLEIVPIRQLPLYDEDLETSLPDEWADFRRQVHAFDGLLFITPEYNRSVPAALKNAIDVGSRPPRENSWDGKPGAVVSISRGQLSGFGANHHLRQSLVCLNVPVMAQPEAYIGGIATLFDESGTLINESTKDFLKSFMDAFEKWVDTTRLK